MYGYQDSNDLGPGKASGKFGLNTGAFVTKFEYNPNSGTDGAEGDAIDFTVQIGEREYRRRFFPVGKVYAKGGGEITDTNSEEYKEALSKEVALLNGTLSHIVTCFVSEEDIKQALSAPIASFKDYAQVLERLVKSTPNWDKTPVDVFLHYQWTIKGDNDKTYLELPKNVKHGIFVTKSQGAGFSEVEGDSIKYANEAGTTHPFKRSGWYKDSAFANQTSLNTASSQSMAGNSAGSTW